VIPELPLETPASPPPPNDDRLFSMQRRALYAFKPPPKLTPSEWADREFYLSPESAAEPGRWHTLPYQREVLDAFTDPLVEEVVWMKSARVGYTKCINIVTAYHIKHDPCAIMIVLPTLEDAEGHSKEEIAPMLRDCPSLTNLVSDVKARDSDNTILRKLFPGGSLTLVGANSPRGFRRVSRRIVLFDEIDGYPRSAGTEGDPLRLGKKRTEYYWNRKIGYGSTPTDVGVSRIEAKFEAGDQRYFYVPCPHCGHMDRLVFREDTTDRAGEPIGHFMVWPKERPEQAHFVCRGCGGQIDEKHKREMIEAGAWRASAPFNGCASFHIWTAYSYSPNATWAHIASEFIEADKGGPEELKTFVNTTLGETWKTKGQTPDWERIYNRRDKYEMGRCPRGVLFLTAGVDAQKDRLVYEVVGWGRGKASWSIDIGVIPGDPMDDTANGPWNALDALLVRIYPHESGAELPIATMAIDSGAFTQAVYNWVRRHPGSRVIAIKGTERAKQIVGQPSPVDVDFKGVKIANGCKVWPLGVNIAKTELYGWLGLKRPTVEALAAAGQEPPGACHFSQSHGEDFFKQLTAETVKSVTKRGFTFWVWELQKGRENHHLDTRVYARAAAAVVGLDRFQENDWLSLEHATGQHSAPPDTPPPVARPGRFGRSQYLGRG
jgi:phage terminase large subunit GpA-like protein